METTQVAPDPAQVLSEANSMALHLALARVAAKLHDDIADLADAP